MSGCNFNKVLRTDNNVKCNVKINNDNDIAKV
jgi:hypothetical protein